MTDDTSKQYGHIIAFITTLGIFFFFFFETELTVIITTFTQLLKNKEQQRSRNVFPGIKTVIIGPAGLLFLSPRRSRIKTVHDRISLAGINQLPSVPQIAKVSSEAHRV